MVLAAGGRWIATQLARQLAEPAPYERAQVELGHYRELTPRWREWANVTDAAGELAADVMDLIADEV